MESVIHLLDSTEALATIGPIVTRIIVTAPTETADFDRIGALVEAQLTCSPLAGVWVVVHHGAPIPDGVVRRHGGRMFERHRDRVTVAYAMLGLGFWASAATTATIALNRMLGVRSHVETTVERSAEQLCMELVGVDPNRLVAFHDDLLARMQPGAAPSSPEQPAR